MTLREFYGHALTETHTDHAGNVTTVVHEPRFDDVEREQWVAKWEYDQETCPKCGNQRSVCSDPNVDNYPQKFTCWVSAAQSVALRKWGKKVEKARPDGAGYLPDDGVSVWMAREDLNPDDDFLASGHDAPAKQEQADDTEDDS